MDALSLQVGIASAEFSPLARTGGLGDAVAGLARALVKAGHRVTAVLPLYRHLASVGEPIRPAPLSAVWRRYEVDSVEVLLLDDPVAFDRSGIYGPVPGSGFKDSWWRWGRFALAVAQASDDFDVLHLHDAHVGAAALLARGPVVFTLHNPAHPVIGPLDKAADLLGLGARAVAPMGPLEWYGSANYLKAGLMAAHRASTVSPTFATSLHRDTPESFGLGGVIRSLPRPLVGILNGIDAGSWDPRTDPWLPAPFSADDLSGRDEARALLIERSGLDEGVVFGMVGRIAAQKGISLLDDIVDGIVADGFRFVAVGNGDLDPMLDGWVRRHPKAIAHYPFADDISRLVFGGADAYLMPSEFEPSGLGQLYAMRYGCPPVVRLTGGLADSVVDADDDPEAGTGFGFRAYLSEELAKTVRRAMAYRSASPDRWGALQRRGMTTDWSWEGRVPEYEALYRDAMTGP